MRYSTLAVTAVALLASFATAFDADAAKKRRIVMKRVAGGSAIAAAINSAIHSARYERGYVCYSDHYHYGSGSGGARDKAERAAIGAWSSFVDFEYGSAWANYGRAGSKKMTCSQGSGGWDCSVEARPCKGI